MNKKTFNTIISESVKEALFEYSISYKFVMEGLKLNEAHQPVVNEIQTAIEVVEEQWQSPDDSWWIKIEARFKDYINFNKRHPKNNRNLWWSRVGGMDGTDRENHVGYVLVRGATKEDAVNSIKNAVVHLNPWAAKKVGTDKIYSNGNAQAIVSVCNMFFARAYMTINSRSMKDTISMARYDKKKGYFKGREFHHEIGRARSGIGKYTHVDWDSLRPWGLIDCDVDDATAQKKLEDYLQANNIVPFKTYLSHDGKHYLLKQKDAKNLDFSFMDKYSTNNRKGDPNVLYKPDANMLVYSAVGV